MNNDTLPDAPAVPTRTGRPARAGGVSHEHLQLPEARRAFRIVKRWILVYWGVAVAALLAAIVMHDDAAEVNVNVWSRCAVVVVSAGLLYLFAVLASRGRRRAYRRLRIISIVVPIGIIAIVISPGYPIWMRIEQIVCGLVVIRLAVAINSKHLRRLFQMTSPVD
jgi:cytochrome bd-type quinol oxidase subunit 2